MNNAFFRVLTLSVITFLFPIVNYADEAKPDFVTLCTDAWMKKSDDAKDKVDFKNFGEKYCGCASKLPLDTDEAVNKAVHLCMSRTLLHDAMDSLEDEVGLSKATESDINDYCLDRWNLVDPKQSDDDKKLISAYCECAKPKLMDLVKQSDSMTDKQYDDTINNIANGCSDNAVATKPTPAK